MGDASESYVRSNSIHHSYNRAAAIAGSNRAEVSHNFGFSIRGHAIVISNGKEQGNVIEENLIVSTISSPAGLNSEAQPAAFWTASPTNTWRHNRAVGREPKQLLQADRAHPLPVRRAERLAQARLLV